MNVTPMMQQYQQIKQAHPGALLLFRMGDFYEMFYEDAETAARVLNLALTSRDKGDNPVPMAGFPYHALESYLGKLIRAGYRVAICDQVEDPREAKGLVRREVTRVVTPGTLTDEGLLDPRRSNYLAAIAPSESRVGLAWVELSTGTFRAAELAPQELADELGRLEPAECLLPEEADAPRAPGPAPQRDAGSETPPTQAQAPTLAQLVVGDSASNGRVLTRRPRWCFSPVQAREALLRHLKTATLEGFDLEDDSPAILAAGALVQYLTETHKAGLEHIVRLSAYRRGSTLVMDESTRRSLELARTAREGRRDGSLLAVLDETVTPMGARLLADWLANPLTDRAGIEARHESVAEFVSDPTLVRELRAALRQAYDLERLAGRIASDRATPRDLGFLTRTLALLPAIKAKLTARRASLLAELEARVDLCADLRAELDEALVDDPPLVATEGGIIRSGCHAALDELRQLSSGGKQWIAQYQAAEIERTGIPSLKVGFNQVFGYYLEVTHTHAGKVPPDYTRKQTLKNAERYITPELKEHEDKVLRAEERTRELEYELFTALRRRVADQGRRVQETARVLATLDVLLCLASIAQARNYCRPVMLDEPILEITDGRHPVLECQQLAGQFVPNDVKLGGSAGRILLVTGPNMAGKSTYIRQTALLVLMAQMGSFVPAKEARIGIADRIFARIGAADELSRGQSTFMVEMIETARILNAASERSLVILDEIGRGTSTYDGVSLAWAVAEYLHDHVGCRTLFATHYHELTELAQTLPELRNLNVAVREWHDEIIFLHKIVDGGADKSYGLHVARLAGVPREVLARAKTILATLERDHAIPQKPQSRRSSGPGRRSSASQRYLFDPHEHPLVEEVRQFNVDETTPLEAMQKLKEWQDRLRQ